MLYQVTEKQQKALDIVLSERAYQDMRIARDGTTAPNEHYHSPEEFLLYIEYYAQKAREVASTTWGPECKPAVMDVIRKITALGFAAIEMNGAPRREGF